MTIRKNLLSLRSIRFIGGLSGNRWRSSNMAGQAMTAAVLVSLPFLGGCNIMKSLALYTAPKSEKVEADFSRLPGKKVLVSVWVPIDIKWDYPYIRLELAKHVGAYLKTNVKDITLIEAENVEAYLEKSRTPEVDPVELGRHFNADMVIHLSVYQFSTRDPGMAHYYRGRLASAVEVYDLTTKAETPERTPLREVKVIYPEEKEIGFVNVRPEQVRQATYEAFAVEVGRKFHEWERPLD